MVFGGELHGGERGVLTEVLGGDLVGGDAGVGVDTLGGLGANAAKPGGGAEGMNGGGVGGAMAEAADDVEAVTVGFEGLENGREFKARAFGGGSPLVHHGAVRHINEANSGAGLGGGLREGRLRGEHGVEQGQGERDAYATQERAAREMLLRNEHQ